MIKEEKHYTVNVGFAIIILQWDLTLRESQSVYRYRMSMICVYHTAHSARHVGGGGRTSRALIHDGEAHLSL